MSTTPQLNRQFARWFDDGRIRDALLGRGDCFVGDSTFRSSHDSLLAMQTLLQWAKDRAIIPEVHDEFCSILADLESRGDYTALRDLLLSYDLSSHDCKTGLGLDMDSWTIRLADAMMHRLQLVRGDEHFACSLGILAKRWPAIQSVVAALNETS
ncbi:hypothetical protein SH528x_002316 [Novipirellula sp. SH528]|uniref:hypothetical protein n=1 Tax=Novipirellula sp. SH528 TaxID=3454466 RepID=UPI003FA15ACA